MSVFERQPICPIALVPGCVVVFLFNHVAQYLHSRTDSFTASGFTMAMPVVYTWYPTYSRYPEYGADYRWFYNMLKIGSNAGENTPSGIPLATFVHWDTTAPPDNPDGSVKQMSKEAYKELLWYLLLRGHDMFFSWCLKEELIEEMELLQQVYNESLPFTNWLKSGRPVIFDVPVKESVVISGIKFENKLLIRRTNFKKDKKPVTIKIDGKDIQVPDKPNSVQILQIE